MSLIERHQCPGSPTQLTPAPLTSGKTPRTNQQHPRGVGCSPCTDGTAAIPGAQQGTNVPQWGSHCPWCLGQVGGSCHAPPQHLWVKLWRRAGMTSGACELSALARLPPEQPCLHSCGPAAPTQARTPGPAGPFRPRDSPWPAPSVGWSSSSLPSLLIPPQHRGWEHPVTKAMLPWSRGA